MEELVTLYAPLANRGELKPIKYSALTDAPTGGVRMLRILVKRYATTVSRCGFAAPHAACAYAEMSRG